MITFDKPQNLNGKELREELRAAGIEISDLDGAVAESNGKLLLDIDTSSKSAAAAVVAAHNGTTIAPEPTIQDKLASVGLNLDDLKTALGI
jgi:uncharacterized membrane protein YcaP (DUF421 family)